MPAVPGVPGVPAETGSQSVAQTPLLTRRGIGLREFHKLPQIKLAIQLPIVLRIELPIVLPIGLPIVLPIVPIRRRPSRAVTWGHAPLSEPQ